MLYANITITDPPYDVGMQYDQHVDGVDDYVEWVKSWFKLLPRPIIMTPGWGRNMYDIAAIEQPTHTGIWLKTNGNSWTPLGNKNTWEPIFFYGKFPRRLWQDSIQCPISIQAFNEKSKVRHPCPKPLGLFKKLVDGFTLPEDVIVDPFMGTGTTLVAAKELGRKAIGIEISKDYCDIAVSRLQQQSMILEA